MRTNTAQTVKNAMKWLGFALTITLAGAQMRPSTPNWVRPGLVVMYDGGARFMGPHPSALTLVETTRVQSVSNGRVTGSSNLRNGANPMQNNFNWTCMEGGACDTYPARFWVDPQNPTASIHGPNGEPFTVMGRSPSTYGGRTWDGTTMVYQNPASGTQYMVIFDTASGLILAYSESTPAQQTFKHLRYVSAQ